MLLSGCREKLWNNPHQDITKQNIFFSSFGSSPKTLDPAEAYSSDSYEFIGQIYEPPLQYSYLERPYKLVPLAAIALPKVTYFDKNNKVVNENSKDIIRSTYEINIKPKQLFSSHPAFAKHADGRYAYHDLSKEQILQHKNLSSFIEKNTREVTAEDFVYEIKRLASPQLNSPITSIMEQYITGLTELKKELVKFDKTGYIPLNNFNISGITVTSKYSYIIEIKGKYPQFLYWLAMPFFAPIAWEVDKFYAQPGMYENNLNLAWQPVGAGPFYLSKNDPNSLMILSKNPNFHGETYPVANKDTNAKIANMSGRQLPLVDHIYFNLEKENTPYWYKFMQGYYDKAAISSDNFNQAVTISQQGKLKPTKKIQNLGITLQESVQPSIYYLGFNMTDPVVGGDSEANRYLRQAISIAVDYEEYINIFLNGRAIAATNPIPPGILSSNDEFFNSYVYDKDEKGITRKKIEEAKVLLAKAGYPNGRAKNGKQLTLYLDVNSGTPSSNSRDKWYQKQLAKLGIDLYIRDTSWNRLQEKMRTATIQLFSIGWNADYPDPENFLFLLYGPNNKVNNNGENISNFINQEYDKMFIKMRNMSDSPERSEVIKAMIKILQRESPWVWGYYPKSFLLSHQWNGFAISNPIATNNYKYLAIDGKLRHKLQQQWNRPKKIVLWIFLTTIAALIIAASYWQRQRNHASYIKKY